MRILYLAVGGKYGSDKSLLGLVSILKRKGADIYVVINEAGGLEQDLSELNIPYRVCRLGISYYETPRNLNDYILLPAKLGLNLFRHFVAYWKIKKLARSFNPDIIHTNVGVFVTGFWVAKVCKIPHVWHLREFEDLDFNLKFIGGKERYISKLKYKNNYSIAISKGIFLHYKLQNIERAVIIYNGILNGNGQNIAGDEPQNNEYFLYIGNITEQKGVSDMIDAFCKMKELGNHELWICGDCTASYKEKLLSLYASKENFKKIKFLGYQREIGYLLKGAIAIIVPSHFEALGRTMIEAMSNGCIVVGRNVAGLKEQFDNGVDYCGQEIGFRFNSTAELVDILSYMCRNNKSLEQMRINAKRTVYHYYECNRYAEKIYGIYEKILSTM